VEPDFELTDEQLAVLAGYEDDGSEAWYHKPCFKHLLKEGTGEFELMRALANQVQGLRRSLAECEADYAAAVAVTVYPARVSINP
jgi:hypothetical protein